MIRSIGLGLVAAIAVAIGLVFWFQRSIGDQIFASVAAQRLAGNQLDLGDGLHVILCGTGSPFPNPQRAGPCNAVIAGDQAYVIDVGEGGARNLNLMGFPIPETDALLLTHYHSDHIDGVGPLALFYWTQGTSTAPLRVYGPQGLERVVGGFNQAYELDHGYRVGHHGDDIVPDAGGGLEARPFEIGEKPVVVLERDGLTITAFLVEHDPVEPAIGYRFDYKGRSAVISGDTARTDLLEKASTGVDLLVHDALQPRLVGHLSKALKDSGNDNVSQITRDILDYHASPEDAAKSAQKAGAKKLVLSHLVPAVPNSFFYPAFLGDAEDYYDGEIVVGEDGMIFSLPLESEAITMRKAL